MLDTFLISSHFIEDMVFMTKIETGFQTLR